MRIAHIHFPRRAAATTLERRGETFYFMGEETRRAFAQQHGIESK
jgi:YHS domain-containing protein